jgi:hypothetical protein
LHQNLKSQGDPVRIVYIDPICINPNQFLVPFHKHEVECPEKTAECRICGRSCNIYIKSDDMIEVDVRLKDKYNINRTQILTLVTSTVIIKFIYLLKCTPFHPYPHCVLQLILIQPSRE